MCAIDLSNIDVSTPFFDAAITALKEEIQAHFPKLPEEGVESLAEDYRRRLRLLWEAQQRRRNDDTILAVIVAERGRGMRRDYGCRHRGGPRN